MVRIATSRARETQKGNEGSADLSEEFETVLRRNTTRRLGFGSKDMRQVHTDRQITTSTKEGNDALASAAAHHDGPKA